MALEAHHLRPKEGELRRGEIVCRDPIGALGRLPILSEALVRDLVRVLRLG